jgi:hypothetical protein
LSVFEINIKKGKQQEMPLGNDQPNPPPNPQGSPQVVSNPYSAGQPSQNNSQNGTQSYTPIYRYGTPTPTPTPWFSRKKKSNTVFESFDDRQNSDKCNCECNSDCYAFYSIVSALLPPIGLLIACYYWHYDVGKLCLKISLGMLAVYLFFVIIFLCAK